MLASEQRSRARTLLATSQSAIACSVKSHPVHSKGHRGFGGKPCQAWAATSAGAAVWPGTGFRKFARIDDSPHPAQWEALLPRAALSRQGARAVVSNLLSPPEPWPRSSATHGAGKKAKGILEEEENGPAPVTPR